MKILVYTSLEIDNMIDLTSTIIAETADNSSVFSPCMIALGQTLQDEKPDLTLYSLAVARNIKREEQIPWLPEKENHIYVGPALRSLSFDKMLVSREAIASAQEAFLRERLEEELEELYNSDMGTDYFDTNEELIAHLKEMIENGTTT